MCFRCAFGVALHAARADLLRFGHLTHSLRRADTRTGLTPQRGGLGRGTRGRTSIVVNEGALRQHGAGADPRTGASSSGTKPALKAAAPLTARTPAPGLRCEAPRGGATNRASHPRLLKTVNISPQNRHNLRKHKRAHEQASSSCAEIDSVPPRSVDLDRAMRSLPERPVRR